MKLNKIIDPHFRGIVSIYRENQPLDSVVSGYRDLPNEINNSLDTRFASASAGKAFVAVAIMQLIEKHKLSLQDTLDRYLEVELMATLDPKVTIEQLLTHTSGVPDYFDESIMDEYEALWIDFPNYRIRRNSDLLPLFNTKPMMYPKGEKFHYNNTGYVLLAMIIEVIVHCPFDQYIHDSIFMRANMSDSGYFELDRLPSRCANNYIALEEGTYRTNIYSVDAKGTGAGGAFISVNDIHAFWEPLLSYRLVSEASLNQMFSPHAQENQIYYGYGFWLRKDQDIYLPSFQGMDPGVSFFTEYHPIKKLTSVLVSNFGDNVWKEMQSIRQVYY